MSVENEIISGKTTNNAWLYQFWGRFIILRSCLSKHQEHAPHFYMDYRPLTTTLLRLSLCLLPENRIWQWKIVIILIKNSILLYFEKGLWVYYSPLPKVGPVHPPTLRESVNSQMVVCMEGSGFDPRCPQRTRRSPFSPKTWIGYQTPCWMNQYNGRVTISAAVERWHGTTLAERLAAGHRSCPSLPLGT